MRTLPNFVSMKKTPADLMADKADMCVPMDSPQDLYPYGLCLSLDEESLEKLNLDDAPDVGDSILMMCVARVTSASKRETNEGTKSRIELQITDIAIEGEEEEEEDEKKVSSTSLFEKMYKS